MPGPIASILITVPPGRRTPGTLTFRGADGGELYSCPCLARSAGDAKNPTRDPLKYRGNTPTGFYAATFVSHLPHAVAGIGTLWVTLDPDNVHDSQAARAEAAGRRGLGIHGGRGDSLLKPTHGCVRLYDRDMAMLARIAGKQRFTVEVQEPSAEGTSA